MIVTRVAIGTGVVVLGLLCWLAAIGATEFVAPLVTMGALVVLVGGGNWLSGRSGPRGTTAPRSAVASQKTPAPAAAPPADPPADPPAAEDQ